MSSTSDRGKAGERRQPATGSARIAEASGRAIISRAFVA